MSKPPASVLEILGGLGLGTAATVGVLVTTACVGNPAPAPVDAPRAEDAGVQADAQAEPDANP
jgi:hypothetical protein